MSGLAKDLRFGPGALAASAAISAVGLAAAALSIDFRRQRPFLAAGLILALLVLPVFLAGAIRALAAAREAAAHAEAGRKRCLGLIADTLRGAVAINHPPPQIAAQIKDVIDYAALEAGTFAAPRESFDLRTLIKQSLAKLPAKAAENGGALRWRIDPRLPCLLRGQAQALIGILSGLAEHAVATAPGARVRLTADAGAGGDARRLRLRIRVDRLGPCCPSDATGPSDATRPSDATGAPLALCRVERLVALAGGRLAIDLPPGHRGRLSVTLPLAIEAAAPAPLLDLAGRPVVIVTADDSLAGALAEALAAWGAEPCWAGDADEALAGLVRVRETPRPIVIVDGRDGLLSALGLAHQAARLRDAGPFVLLIAEEARAAAVAELDEGELDGIIPAPVTEQLLANAVSGLPLEPDRPTPRRGEPPLFGASPEGQPATRDWRRDDARITPIAAHPRFASDATPAVDPRVINGLRTLGGGPGFLREIIETFRADASQIMRRIEQESAAGDAARFARSLVALHRAAGHLGGAQLCELAASLQRLTASELRQQGPAHVQRLHSEIERLAAALIEYLPAGEARRP